MRILKAATSIISTCNTYERSKATVCGQQINKRRKGEVQSDLRIEKQATAMGVMVADARTVSASAVSEIRSIGPILQLASFHVQFGMVVTLRVKVVTKMKSRFPCDTMSFALRWYSKFAWVHTSTYDS